MRLAVPPVLAPIVQAIQGTPFQDRVHLVGGAVRDQLLGLGAGEDLDLVVEGDAPGLAEMLWEMGIALAPPETYPRFGTAMLRIPGAIVELAWARRESYDFDSRKPFTEAGTLQEDAHRRDFTINALMLDLSSGEVLDLTGSGLADLEGKILRTPLDPARTFHDDPLRMLRAVRFKWRLGFEFAPGLEHAILQMAERMQIVSAERIREEISKMLLHPTAPQAMDDLMRLQLFHEIAPELEEMPGVEQGRWHHLDVWGHTLEVLSRIQEPDVILRWAAILHDVAKPRTRVIDEEGQTRFFTHEVVGAEMAKEILLRLRFSIKDAERGALLVKNHMRLGTVTDPSDSAIRRLIRDLGDDLDALISLVEADAASLKKGVRALDLGVLKERIKEISERSPAKVLESPLSGEEIMQVLCIWPGREVGRYKNLLTEAVLEGRIAPHDRDAARELLAEYAAGSHPEAS